MFNKFPWLSKLLMVAAVPALAIAIVALLPAVMAAGTSHTTATPASHVAPPAPPAPAASPAPPAPPARRHHDDDDDDDAEVQETAWLGVSLDEIEEEGARVSSVVDDSPAAEAGLRKGDRIIGIEGAKVISSRDVVRSVRRASPGEKISIRILRDGDEKTVTATLAGRRIHQRHEFRFVTPEAPDAPEPLDMEDLDVEIDKGGPGHHTFLFAGPPRTWLGVEVHPMSGDLREALKAPRDRGILVNRVVENSPAADSGIRAGDIIISVDGKDVDNIGDIGRALGDRDEGDKVSVSVIRDGSEKTIDVKVSDRPGRRGRRSWVGPRGMSDEEREAIERSVQEAMRSAHEALRRAGVEMRVQKDRMREQQDQMREQIRKQMEDLKETIRQQPVRVISAGSVYDI
ncbi:MAG TPA: PDZ domain-containing protein [Candidatus Polarisedimenticolia bacterium]|jgi:membrane-associated protease RseP (regulator of RpoE activity)